MKRRSASFTTAMLTALSSLQTTVSLLHALALWASRQKIRSSILFVVTMVQGAKTRKIWRLTLEFSRKTTQQTLPNVNAP